MKAEVERLKGHLIRASATLGFEKNYSQKRKLRKILEDKFPEIHAKVRVGPKGGFSIRKLFSFLQLPVKGNCESCGKRTDFDSMKLKPKRFCSSQCISKSDVIKQQKRETCARNFGVSNPSQDASVKQKKADTCLKHYGVTNPSMAEEVKREKSRTCFENYGVSNPFQSKELQKKSKQTMLLRHGVEWAMQSEECREKRRRTYVENYGVEHPLQNKEVMHRKEKTYFSKHGIRHHFHNPEIFRKLRQSSFKNHEFHGKDGRVQIFQGYEGTVLAELESRANVKSFSSLQESLAIFYLADGKERAYYPDIRVTLKSGKKLLVEVKSEWTLWGKEAFFRKNLEKFEAAEKLCKAKDNWSFWLALVKNGRVHWVENPSKKLH